MATPVFAPLAALHRPGDSIQTVRRTVQQIANPAGLYAEIPHSAFPVGEHALDLLFLDDDEIAAFWAFYADIQGALIPFWVPSFQADFELAAPIEDDDTSILVESFRYTELLFPDPNRVDLAFVRSDGTFLKRTVVDAEDNGDGTESLVLNEALGENWMSLPSNGLCFCWYVRLSDDVARVSYDTRSTGAAQFVVVEDKEPPSGSGTEMSMP